MGSKSGLLLGQGISWLRASLDHKLGRPPWVCGVRKQSGQHLSSLVLVLLLLPFAWGCSSNEPQPEPEAKELTQSSTKSVDTPELELLETAKQQFASGLLSVARDQFISLKDSYPSGAYAELAELKAADASFELNNFADAAMAYEEFTKAHPSSPANAYAMLRAGRSLQLSARGAGRDISPIERANEWYDKLMARFPSSPYTGAARQLKQEGLRTIAEHQRMVSSFYSNRQAEDAALEREKEASRVESMAQSLAPPIAIQQVRRIPLLVRNEELRPAIGSVRRISRAQLVMARLAKDAAERSPTPDQDIPAGFRRIRKIECVGLQSPGEQSSEQPRTPQKRQLSGSSRQIFIHLSEPFDEPAYLNQFSRIRSPLGYLTLSLPHTTGEARTIDCFGKGDLKVEADGRISLTNTSEVILMSLENPPRLLVSVKPRRVD